MWQTRRELFLFLELALVNRKAFGLDGDEWRFRLSKDNFALGNEIGFVWIDGTFNPAPFAFLSQNARNNKNFSPIHELFSSLVCWINDFLFASSLYFADIMRRYFSSSRKAIINHDRYRLLPTVVVSWVSEMELYEERSFQTSFDCTKNSPHARRKYDNLSLSGKLSAG